MASIHRHSSGRSPYWWAKFRGPDGKVVFRSTKKKKRKEAWPVVLGWEQAAGMAREGSLTEAQSRKILSEILEKATGATLRHISTEGFFKDWIEGKEATRSPRTAERYSNVMRLFLTSLGNRAKRPLGAVSSQDIQSFLNARLNSRLAPKTVRADVKTLNNAFNRALRQGLIDSNPVVAVELPSTVSSEKDVFSSAQVQMLVVAADSMDWKTAILLGYFTGARLRDCVVMEWENVDLAKSILTYEPQKT